jgi:hypothetical protein
MTGVYAVVIALALVVALLGMLIIGLLRSHADILRRLEGLGAGMDGGHDHGSQMTLTRRPEGQTVAGRRISGITPGGESAVVSLATGPDPTLLAFLSTTCSTCTPFWEGLQSSSMYFGGHRHRVIAVTLGESEESPTRALSMASPGLDVIMSSTAWSEFEVPGAPYFVVVAPGTGVVTGEGSAMTFDSLEEFLSDATNDEKWDLQARQGLYDEESRIDADLRRAGIVPNDPRLYPSKGDIDERGER